jgi:hypothetical protein
MQKNERPLQSSGEQTVPRHTVRKSMQHYVTPLAPKTSELTSSDVELSERSSVASSWWGQYAGVQNANRWAGRYSLNPWANQHGERSAAVAQVSLSAPTTASKILPAVANVGMITSMKGRLSPQLDELPLRWLPGPSPLGSPQTSSVGPLQASSAQGSRYYSRPLARSSSPTDHPGPTQIYMLSI